MAELDDDRRLRPDARRGDGEGGGGEGGAPGGGEGHGESPWSSHAVGRRCARFSGAAVLAACWLSAVGHRRQPLRKAARAVLQWPQPRLARGLRLSAADPWTRPIRTPPGSAAPRSGATPSRRRRCAALSATLDRDDPPPRPGTRAAAALALAVLPAAGTGRARSAPTATRSAAASCRRCRCRAACGPAAGSRSLQPLRVGDAVTRTSRIASIAQQAGAHRRRSSSSPSSTRSRPPRGVALSEEHDIVYRDAAGAGRDRDAAAGGADRRDRSRARSCPTTCCCSAIRRSPSTATASTTTARYVTEVEGYPGPDRARPADRDAAGRPAAPRASRRGRCAASTSRRVQPAVRPASASPSAAGPTASAASRSGRGAPRARWRCRRRPRSPDRRLARTAMLKTAPDRFQDIRDAVRALCADFPDEYHRKIDDAARLSRGVRRRADQGRLARRADPAGVRRLGPRPDRGVGDHGGDQPLRRQRRRLPRPDVQHGHAAAPRLATRRSSSTCRRSPAASCACSRWA